MTAKKKETTFRCVATLTIIAVVCGLLLAVLNPLLYVAPTVDEITDNLSIEGKYSAELEELDKELAKSVKGGTVQLVAKITSENGTDYVGMLIKTNSDGQLGECKYAMLINLATNELEQAVYVTDGSTAGRNYATYGDKGENFDDYLIALDSADVYDDFTYPKTGATKTLKAVNNAFKICANYYCNKYSEGGKSA